MSTDVVNTAYSLLDSTLTGDSTLMALVTGVFQMMAPPGTTPDWVILNAQSSADTNSAFGVRILSRLMYQVKVVGPAADNVNIRAAYARIDALLQPSGQPIRNQGGTLACFREGTIQYGEVVNGVLWLHYGGTYRIEVA